MKKIAAALVAVALAGGLSLIGAAPANATGGGHTPSVPKVTLCHAEGEGQWSETDVKVTDVFEIGKHALGKDHKNDIIPADILGSIGGGKNLGTEFGWGYTGQQVLDNGCNVPERPRDDQPADKVTFTEWVDGERACDATTVTQTRGKSVVTSVFDEESWAWVDGEPVVTSEEQTRDLTAEEIRASQSTDPNGDCFVPPVNAQCEPTDGPTSTNLNELWSNVDTRSAGHYEYVEGGLHVWTDDASSNAKVSLGTAASFPLSNTGQIGLDWVGTSPAPGVNLFVTFADGLTGTLVWESVYGGDDLWLTGGSSAGIVAPQTGGGFGSDRHGTINEWLALYPGATVNGIAFSLGSGVLGHGIIESVTVGCTTYYFDHEAPVVVPEKPADIVTTEITEDTDCEADEVIKTSTTTTVGWELVENVWVKTEPVITTATDTRAADDAECPPATTPPTDKPTETPKPTPAPVITPTTPAAPAATPVTPAAVNSGLAETGFDTAPMLVTGAVVLLIGAAISALIAVAGRRKSVR